MPEDIRFSLRALRRRPGLTSAALLTLALGIGASIAVFSVLDGVVLKPLAYPGSRNLVNVYRIDPPVRHGPVSKPDFSIIRERLDGMMRVAGHELITATVGTGQGARRVAGARVTDDFFAVFGLSPLRGRWLDAGDQSGDANGIVISHGFWRERFEGSEDAVGAELLVNDARWTVVGIAPPAMDYPVGADVWTPMRLASLDVGRGYNFIRISGRVADSVTHADVQARLDALAGRLAREYPDNHRNLSLDATGLQDALVSGVRDTLWMLMLAVSLVMLIACGNVGNLLLSRMLAREGEMATRAAIGATAGRLARQAMVEAMLLAGIGAAGGAVLGAIAIEMLLALRPPGLPRLDAVALDLRVTGFVIGAALVTGLLCGGLPALRAFRADFTRVSRSGSTSASRIRPSRWRSMLVVGEVALTMALMVSAGLLLATMKRLANVDPGFETQNLLTAMIALPAPQPPGIDAQAFRAQIRRNAPFLAELQRRLESLPGVDEAGFIDVMPLSGTSNFSGSVRVPDATVDPGGEITVEHRWVSPGYFRAIGVPVVAGEGYETGSEPASALGGSIVINEALADLVWPGDTMDAVGKAIHLGIVFGREFTVGGVVGNARQWGLDREPSPEVYLPYTGWPAPSTTTIVLRTSVAPLTLAEPLRRAVAQLDPGVPVFDVRTMEQAAAAGNARRRFALTLLELFAGAAAVVAAIGLYGVMAYAVVRRTREVGVRMALGAMRSRVLGAFLRDGMAMAIAGIVIGVGIAFLFTRLLQELVWGVETTAPTIYAATAALLATVAFGASLLPAWRASRIAPMEALRDE